MKPISRLRFSAVVPCNKVHRYQCFREIWCLHFVAWRWRHISTTTCIFTLRKSLTGIGPKFQRNLLPPTFYTAAGGMNATLQKTAIRDPSFLQKHSLFFTTLGKVQTEYHAQQLQPRLLPSRRRVSPQDRPVLSTKRLIVERSQF